jgi:hypothetical protein
MSCPQHLRASSHGVPNPTHVNKSQHEDKAIKFWALKNPLKYQWNRTVIMFMQNYSHDLCWELGSHFLLDPTLNTSPKLHLHKVLPCRHPCHHTWDVGLWDPVWCGKPQLPCSQRLRAASHYGCPSREAVGSSSRTLLRVQRTWLKIANKI